MITKLGLLFVYDLETATAVYRNRISPDPIFLTADAPSFGGFYALNRRGQVLLATVNEQTIVPFVSGQVTLPVKDCTMSRTVSSLSSTVIPTCSSITWNSPSTWPSEEIYLVLRDWCELSHVHYYSMTLRAPPSSLPSTCSLSVP